MLRKTPETDDARFVTCPGCDGEGGWEGWAPPTFDDPYASRWEECADCGGSGWVEDCDTLP
jgi:DnaJ-class molecular chaperone